jgi:hypothetical protein
VPGVGGEFDHDLGVAQAAVGIVAVVIS